MSDPFPDKLVIQASGFGPALTARQTIHGAKKIILDLETISPWRRPFEVSGCTEETGDMRIAPDLSNFEELVMRALQSYDDVRFYNENDPDNWDLTPNSFSPYGFSETFTNAPSAGEYNRRVGVHLQFSGFLDGKSRDNGIHVITIPFYGREQFNAAWADPIVVTRLFDYFIDNFNPLKCVVFGSEQAVKISKPDRDYTLGWLNYTRDPAVAGVFTKTGKAVPYRAGVLLKLGDDVSIVSDPKAEAEMIEVAQMLSSAGVPR